MRMLKLHLTGNRSKLSLFWHLSFDFNYKIIKIERMLIFISIRIFSIRIKCSNFIIYPLKSRVQGQYRRN